MVKPRPDGRDRDVEQGGGLFTTEPFERDEHEGLALAVAHGGERGLSARGEFSRCRFALRVHRLRRCGRVEPPAGQASEGPRCRATVATDEHGRDPKQPGLRGAARIKAARGVGQLEEEGLEQVVELLLGNLQSGAEATERVGVAIEQQSQHLEVAALQPSEKLFIRQRR